MGLGAGEMVVEWARESEAGRVCEAEVVVDEETEAVVEDIAAEVRPGCL